MELILAILILGGWYAYKHFQQKKISSKASSGDEVPLIEEVEPAVRVVVRRGSCDFCQGRRYLPSPAHEKMPCPKCRCGEKIS